MKKDVEAIIYKEMNTGLKFPEKQPFELMSTPTWFGSLLRYIE